MKKLLSIIMNLVMWVMTLFFAISVIMFFPSLASVLCCLLVVLVAPIKIIQNFWNAKFKKKWIKYVVIFLLFCATLAAIPESELEDTTESDSIIEELEDDYVDAPNNEEIASSDDVEAVEQTWRSQFSEELVNDIEQAFEEIGENADNITYIEYVGVRETDLFDRRDYKVEFDRGNFVDVLDEDERPWRHSRWYRLTTEEWHEGEPEREQYPREYLVTIKFWTEDNTTNINQWTHTGWGELQK